MPDTPSPAARMDPSFAEFVALIALMMALTALSIDIILVALPAIGATFAIDDPNHRQYMITAYMLGFAGGQPFYGPLSDRFGRKPVLYAGTVLYAVATVAAMVAPSFALILAARALQGFGAASARVIAVAIVRDRFSGRGMSRVMSFVMTIFIILPILAPTIGGAIMLIGPWRWIFLFLLAVAAAILVWTGLRLPETHPHGARGPLSAAHLLLILRQMLGNRQTLGYTVASGFLLGNLLGYIGSAEQLFVEVYGLGKWFPLVFGAVAAVMIPAAQFNARLVERVGMRRMSHTALLFFVATCGVVAAFGFPAHPPLIVFCGILAVLFFCFGLMMPNFNALAMEPMGRVAGTASSFVGFYTTAVAAALGAVVGQAFDGSIRPLILGFAGLGLCVLASVLVTERGRLFRVAPPDGNS